MEREERKSFAVPVGKKVDQDAILQRFSGSPTNDLCDASAGNAAPCGETIYARVAGFAVKMPLKLSRYCRKTSTHNMQATSAGAMVLGDMVM
jgi:hypothetical protein